MMELVDAEEVSEADKSKPKWVFGLKEAEGRKHRTVRAVEGVPVHKVRYEELVL